MILTRWKITRITNVKNRNGDYAKISAIFNRSIMPRNNFFSMEAPQQQKYSHCVCAVGRWPCICT